MFVVTSQILKFVDLSKNRNLAILRTKHRFFSKLKKMFYMKSCNMAKKVFK